MITTAREDLAARLRTRRLHGISRDAWKRYTAQGAWYYEVEYPGFKYNMTDINAALGLHQLRKSDRFHALRARYAARYRAGLGDVPELLMPAEAPAVEHAWHLFIVRVREERLRIGRDEVIEALRARNIGTSVHFIPLHLQPFYQRALDCGPDDFPRATAAYRGAISLPLYPRMTEDDVDDVIDAVRDVIAEHRR